ncbi:MAG TPA: hypothetical protein VMW16_09465 [Sedimentisphaerales bacterium]|nr:hypothetical protein [Sedimentisphaerales bacterium]
MNGRQESKQTDTSASDIILLWFFNHWWGDIREARMWFFRDFVFGQGTPTKRVTWLAIGRRFKDFGKEGDQKGDLELGKQIQKLCDFYDETGFFLISGFLSPREILLPIWHSMRKTWVAIKPFVDMERTEKQGQEYFDPLFKFGFEELFKVCKPTEDYPTYSALRRAHPEGQDISGIEKVSDALFRLEQRFFEEIRKQNEEAKKLAEENNAPPWLIDVLKEPLPKIGRSMEK